MNEVRIPLSLPHVGLAMSAPHADPGVVENEQLQRAHERLYRVITRTLSTLVAEYAMRQPFECTAPIDWTCGLRRMETPLGPVSIVSRVGGPRSIEIREAR